MAEVSMSAKKQELEYLHTPRVPPRYDVARPQPRRLSSLSASFAVWELGAKVTAFFS